MQWKYGQPEFRRIPFSLLGVGDVGRTGAFGVAVNAAVTRRQHATGLTAQRRRRRRGQRQRQFGPGRFAAVPSELRQRPHRHTDAVDAVGAFDATQGRAFRQEERNQLLTRRKSKFRTTKNK